MPAFFEFKDEVHEENLKTFEASTAIVDDDWADACESEKPCDLHHCHTLERTPSVLSEASMQG